ncbi:MAG: redoxin domain-containing protein [Desulfofustis sp.]|jgi:peroxiredoxin (alkyl hydroperoxide reductase subunit C)|nr:redoxin domain-containing protein [Desulfofustis sp.]
MRPAVSNRGSGWTILLALFILSALPFDLHAAERHLSESIYDTGHLKPIDSVLKVAPGDIAPDFELKAISGKSIRLSSYRGRKNVVISFVPAAWTPVCSDQWPGYAITRRYFDDADAVLLGITVDNVATLYAWTRQMGTIWFEVLSDFWPHGATAEAYGLLRSDGTSERALVFIDKHGVIRDIYVSDINVRPPLEYLVEQLAKLK